MILLLIMFIIARCPAQTVERCLSLSNAVKYLFGCISSLQMAERLI